jgi:hypothetical protein
VSKFSISNAAGQGMDMRFGAFGLSYDGEVIQFSGNGNANWIEFHISSNPVVPMWTSTAKTPTPTA